MTEEQFNKLMDKLNAIELLLINSKVTYVYPSGIEIHPCSHSNAYYDSSGWHCPDCGGGYISIVNMEGCNFQ